MLVQSVSVFSLAVFLWALLPEIKQMDDIGCQLDRHLAFFWQPATFSGLQFVVFFLILVILNCDCLWLNEIKIKYYAVCFCFGLHRLHSPAKAGNELKSILDRFREDQDYEKAYRQLIRADFVAPHIVSKSKQQMAALKEHVMNFTLYLCSQGVARKDIPK